MTNEYFMRLALEEAKKAYELDEVPVGCVIVYKNEVIAKAHNQRVSLNKSIAHAEIIAISKANDYFNSWRLDECELFVTLEPCLMCTGAISLARFKKVFYGAKQQKIGNYFENEGLNHYPTVVGGILEDECSQILRNYFKMKRGGD